jgi:uncharacterized protein
MKSNEENFSAPREQQDSPSSPDAQFSPASSTSETRNPEPVALRPQPSPSELPEDLEVPWGWADLALFLVLAVVTFFFLNLVAVRIWSGFGVNLEQIRHSPGKQGVFIFATEVPLFLSLLGYLLLQARERSPRPAWQTLGWGPLPDDPFPRWTVALGLLLSGVLLSLLVSLISAGYQPKVNLPIQSYFENRLSATLLMTMAIAVAPVFEETLFRGYLYPVLARSWGLLPGILVTGTLFGLLHAAQLWGGWVQILLLIGVGILFTYVRAATKTVVASYLLHFSYNLSIFLGFLIASHGLRHLPPLH